MSFDELLPDSEPKPSRDETVPNAEQEASVLDAPPAASSRRRRSRSTGTDAASTSSSAEAKPLRTRRAKSSTTSAEAAADQPTPEPTGQADTIKETAKPARAPRRQKAPAAIESEAVSAPAPPVDTGTPEQARPQRRSRREKTGPSAVPSDTPPVESEPEIVPKAVETTETVLPRKSASRGRGGSRSRAKTQAAEIPAQIAEARAIEAQTAAQEASSAAPPMLHDAPTSGAMRHEGTETPVAETPLTENDSLQAASAAPVAETDTARTGRTRRSRNDRRTKRDTPRMERTEVREAPVLPVPPSPPPTPVVPPKQIDRSVGAHLISRHGLPQIHINNVLYPPVLFFGNMDGARNQQRVLSEVRRAAGAGVHLHSTLVTLPCPLSEAVDALDEIDRLLRAILDADPKGYVMPRIVFVPARGWKREYPTDIATYADGTTGDPSLTSERFWREAEHALESLIMHLSEYEWGGRIFGYHLERGEWFQSADQGYDRSMANREAFRDWLREKYKNNLVALRAAWYDGNVQFHTAEIPPLPTKLNPQRAFFETRRERRIIDFYEFTSESTAKRLAALAGAIKKAAKDQVLVSVCYGYTLEFGHSFSGHLALGQLLRCPDIDLICGPPSYRDRKPGGGASLPAPVDSPPLHGKLWLSEDDTKTFLSSAQEDPDDFNPRLADRFQTEQAHSRAMGRALSSTTGIGFMDLWGEGWLEDDGLWDRIGMFTERYAAFLKNRERARIPDVIALIDEKSLLHIQRGEPFFRKLTNGLRDLLQRAGIAYGTYLQSDLLASDFPTQGKLYLFLTPYRLTSEQRAAIKEKLQGGGRTLAWLYAPGSCEERPLIGGAMDETATGTVGISLLQQEWNSEVGSRILDPRHAVTERLNGREVGVVERLNPSFYVEDPDAVVLAEYQGSGLPSLAVKKCGSWQSVFVGEPVLTLDLLRGICKFAGVHLWTGGGDDVTLIGNGWVTIHANRDGHRALRLPEPTGLYDISERRLVAQELREHRFFLRNGMTRTFYVGSIERMHRLGLPNLSTQDDSHERGISPPRDEHPLDAQPVPDMKEETSVALSEDMQTLQAVLNMDLSQIPDLELEEIPGFETSRREHPLPPDEDAEARLAALLPDVELLPGDKRRRRRGGRGRGRRRSDASTELNTGTTNAPPHAVGEAISASDTVSSIPVEAGAAIDNNGLDASSEEGSDIWFVSAATSVEPTDETSYVETSVETPWADENSMAFAPTETGVPDDSEEG